MVMILSQWLIHQAGQIWSLATEVTAKEFQGQIFTAVFSFEHDWNINL